MELGRTGPSRRDKPWNENPYKPKSKKKRAKTPEVDKKLLLSAFGARQKSRYPTKRGTGIPTIQLLKMEDEEKCN